MKRSKYGKFAADKSKAYSNGFTLIGFLRCFSRVSFVKITGGYFFGFLGMVYNSVIRPSVYHVDVPSNIASSSNMIRTLRFHSGMKTSAFNSME